MKQESASMYVELKYPVSARRELLLSSKDILASLKGLEEVNAIRAKKEKIMIELKKTFDGILFIHRKVRGSLPNISGEKVCTQQAQVSEKKKHQKPTHEMHDKFTYVEHELANIEKELQDLDRS